MSVRYTLSWMPLHVADWLGSESVAMMSPATECAYLRLLMYQWRSDDGSLPADPAKLRPLTRIGGKGWKAAWAALAPHFPVDPDGRRRNPRLAAERAAVLAKRGQQSDAGKASAEARQSQQSLPGGHCNASSGGIAMLPREALEGSQVVENQRSAVNGRSTNVQPKSNNPNPNTNPTPSTAANAAAVSPRAAAASAEVQAVLDRLHPDHRAPVAAYAAELPRARQLAFIGELEALASGMHGPGGKGATWWQIGAGTCAALAGSSTRLLTPMALRGFVHRVPAAPETPASDVPSFAAGTIHHGATVVWHPGMPRGERPDEATIAANGWEVAA